MLLLAVQDVHCLKKTHIIELNAHYYVLCFPYKIFKVYLTYRKYIASCNDSNCTNSFIPFSVKI